MKKLETLRSLQKEQERDLIEHTLVHCHWSITKSAESLGIATSTLQRLIDRHGMRDVANERVKRGRPRGKGDA